MSRGQVFRMVGRTISLLLVGLAVFYIYRTVAQHWEAMRSGPLHFNGGYFLMALLLFQLYWFYQIGLWRWIMSGLGTRLDFLTTCYMFFTNNLLAYIPGKVANVVGMAGLAKQKQFSITHTVTTVVLFQIYSLISGTILIAILSGILPSALETVLPVEWMWMIGVASLVGLLLISPLCLRWTFALLRRLSGRAIADIDLPFRTALMHMVAYGMGWLLAGTAIWCLFKGFGPGEQSLSLAAVVVVLLGSYLVGLLAITVPAGLGITESGMIYGLGVLLGPGQMVFGVGSYRLVTLGTTLVSWLVVGWLQRKSHLLNRGSEHSLIK